ncbi:MAG TPA: CpsB/CapC family capsule biosynthesis tyrosine phosphatase [Methylosinus sp.]|jgi:protein-tyrosine phosphatase|uniref:tyrosine-protein phosphatase n=1 Tax=Methylosinus sp. TaxID=427 RepID=UPI002F936478
MIDLHCHILPAVDDGSRSLDESLEMARMMATDGVAIVACTPHIMPGVFNNDGWTIRAAVAQLQRALDDASIAIHLVVGADVHVAPNLVDGLRSGTILSLHDTRFVLIEPPHHILPPRLDETFFALMAAGRVPVLTHPERLSWIDQRYDVMKRFFNAGVWMQITAGSLLGDFGRGPRYWAERMLDEGMCHILATDAHGARRRAPRLRAGYEAAAKRVGESEAIEMVLRRPYGILENRLASAMAAPAGAEQAETLPESKGLWRRLLKGVGLAADSAPQ